MTEESHIPEETAEKMAYLTRRSERRRRWFHAHEPQPIGKVLGQVLINNRYASTEANTALADAWTAVVGQAIAKRSQPTGVRRGNFEVTVAHSAIAQELSFDQPRLVRGLQEKLPEVKITNVRFRIGTIG